MPFVFVIYSCWGVVGTPNLIFSKFPFTVYGSAHYSQNKNFLMIFGGVVISLIFIPQNYTTWHSPLSRRHKCLEFSSCMTGILKSQIQKTVLSRTRKLSRSTSVQWYCQALFLRITQCGRRSSLAGLSFLRLSFYAFIGKSPPVAYISRLLCTRMWVLLHFFYFNGLTCCWPLLTLICGNAKLVIAEVSLPLHTLLLNCFAPSFSSL